MSGWDESQAAARLRQASQLEVPEPPPLATVRSVAVSRARRNAQVMAFALALPLGAMAAVGSYALKVSHTGENKNQALPLPRRAEGRGEGKPAAKPEVAAPERAPERAPEVAAVASPQPPARSVRPVVAPPAPLTPALSPTGEREAIGGYAPPSPPAAPQRTQLADEAQALSSALAALRVQRDPAAALEQLTAYRQRFPAGALRHEAALATVEAHRALGHAAEALAALDDVPRRAELDVLRAELNAELGHCDAARAVLSGLTVTGDLRERAVFTDATCALTLGQRDEAVALLEQLPDSARAQLLLQKLKAAP